MGTVKWCANIGAGMLAALAACCLPGAVQAQESDADKAAIEIVKAATDEQILKELQRRHDARRAVPTTLGGGFFSRRSPVVARNVPVGLEAVDDASLMMALHMTSRAIYGVDERREWHQVEDANVLRLARASVALFRGADTQISASNVKLKTSTLGEDQALCPGEPFADQATGAFCSGTLVREDVVLTAGHCLREVSNKPGLPYVNALSFVFGYRVEKPGASGTTSVGADQLYHGKQVLAGEFFQARDWALVQLDRPVPKTVAEPVTTWNPKVAKGQKVFVIGYPSGLPMKYAPNAEIRDVSNPAFFVANLDTFGGNSGSGVFDEATNALVGVLVRGETDYVKDETRSCMRAYVCPTSSCRGEDVTRINLVPTP